MSDSLSEGFFTSTAKIHAVPDATVHSWVKDGMPTEPLSADEWLRKKKRGKYKPGKVPSLPDLGPAKPTGDGNSDLSAILARANEADPGVMGMYARAVAVERAAFARAMGAEAGSSDVVAFAKAQEAVSDAASMVAKAEEEAGRLRPMSAILAAIKHQWQTCGMLLESMPDSVVDMLVNQPRPVQVDVLRRATAGIKRKLLETYPFTAPLADDAEVFEEPDAQEADKE